MNISKLARQLKVTTEELFDKLPQLGFDIGRRAIKVDEQIADKIIEAWRKRAKQDRELSRIAQIRGESQKPEEIVAVDQIVKEIKVPSVITVREFANLLDLPVNRVLVELMKNGVLTSMNERIDFDTAAIIGEELGFKIIEDQTKVFDDFFLQGQEKLKSALEEKSDELKPRPPVVVVMGHVDHGKTKILDAIRKTDVVSQESGGITQHIGAYQVTVRSKDELSSQVQSEVLAPEILPRQKAARDDFSLWRKITFIDTPGHEAFTAMRSRGARVADVAVLVIAADDSIQPQTKEAIKIIQDARLPFIVAINKIDKSEANIEKVKQDLAAINLLPEDWGGQVICLPVSAKAGTGIDELLETILLVADLDKEKIMANPNRPAIGTIIESHIDKGEGPVATILVQAGTLKIGDVLSLENNFLGKVRILKDYKGEAVADAKPGDPVKVLGLKAAPEVGNILEVASDIKLLNKDIRKIKIKQEKDFSSQIKKTKEDDLKKFINLIVKADVLGSVGVIVESLAKLEISDIKIKIISKGLGIITEADVLKAEATKARIIGFHVKPMPAVLDLARDKNVEIKYYQVIYHLIEDIKKEIEGLKQKESARQLAGKLEVLKIFRQEARQMIVGGRVISGGLGASNTVIVTRGGEAISSGRVNRLECARQAVEQVGSGQECGVAFEGEPVIEAGDVLEFYQEK